jgi:hypothetical protein
VPTVRLKRHGLGFGPNNICRSALSADLVVMSSHFAQIRAARSVAPATQTPTEDCAKLSRLTQNTATFWKKSRHSTHVHALPRTCNPVDFCERSKQCAATASVRSIELCSAVQPLTSPLSLILLLLFAHLSMWAAGAGSGVVAAAICSPLDVVKVCS